ncbi:MAG: aminoacyl-tRNA hydrolase, partial [Verrucomicrobiae bacterium]|nr:aminoacyl-tRNA hydrolase [Verrucomicrobiae bacterium]
SAASDVYKRQVNKLAADANAQWRLEAKFDAEVAEWRAADRKIVLAKPVTFMNLCGRACVALARWHKLEPSQMLVVMDDADLELGRLRLRLFGGTGGHKGLASIGECLGTDQFPRLRIGIGRPAGEAARANGLSDYVLARFRDDEQSIVDDAVKRAAEAVVCAVDRGMDAAMNEFNG